MKTTAANATDKYLMRKCPYVVGQVNVYCLFTRMNFLKRRKTSSKVDIRDGARKEIELLFLHEVVSEVGKFGISPACLSISTRHP